MISNVSKDDTYIYLNRESWIVDHDDIRDRLIGYMAPHSDQYFSILNGMFLFRVKKLKRLNSLPHVLARDGVLPLLKFFWDHPEPKDFYGTIIVHQSCAPLVPKEWREKIYLYRDVSFIPEKEEGERKNIVITGMPDQSCFDYETVFSKLNGFIKEKNIERVYVCLFNNDWRVSQMHKEENGEYFELIKGLTLAFGDRVHFLTWEELQKIHFDDAYFWDFCTYPFYYTDSFIKHQVLSCGGKLIEEEARLYNPIEESHIERLSPYHGHEVFSTNSFDTSIQKDIETRIEQVAGIIEDGEKMLSNYLEYYPSPQICTDDLKSFAQYLCKKYIKN